MAGSNTKRGQSAPAAGVRGVSSGGANSGFAGPFRTESPLASLPTSAAGNGSSSGLTLAGATDGLAVVASDTPLKRLNYFDGKFLRAEDMQAEQDYLRTLVQLSNRAGGSGVVNGYDTLLAQGGAAVSVGPGLAMDPAGRALLMPIAKTMALDDLIAASAGAQGTVAPSSPGVAGSADFADCTVAAAATGAVAGQSGDLYLLTVGFLEALCGEEDVFGQICDTACVQSKDRRWRMEGVLFRAVPLTLQTALAVSKAVPADPNQLRSRVASATFEDERRAIASLVNGTSLKASLTWCLGAQAEAGDAVPLAVFSRSGGVTKFLDAWTARRERMEESPRRYWAWRLAMRPWAVFLAQVLQFQCQLRDLFSGLVDGGTGGDPCAQKTAALGKAAALLADLEAWHTKLAQALTPAAKAALAVQPFQISQIVSVKNALAGASGPTGLQGTRILIDGGIVELPSAGYLPVTVGGPTVNEQVRHLLGPGVDLRFCLCRPDYIPHVLEEAQHMERVSLLAGIDDPKSMPRVDVFVPDGQQGPRADRGSRYFDAAFGLGSQSGRNTRAAPPRLVQRVASDVRSRSGLAAASESQPAVEGASRWAPYGDSGQQFYWAGVSRGSTQIANPDLTAYWFEATVDRDPFALAGPSQVMNLFARAISHQPFSQVSAGIEIINLRFTPSGPAVPGSQPGEVVIEGTMAGGMVSNAPPGSGGGGGPVTMALRLRRLVAPTGGKITVEPLTQQPSGYFYWQWTGGSALTGALHSVQVDSTGKVVSDVSIFAVKEDPDAQSPSNPFHGLSETAIPLLQTQLATAPSGDPGFAAYAEPALFPPPDPTLSFDVVAALDWVLFARRRETSCDQQLFTPVAADEKFQVYWVDSAQVPDNFPDLLVSSDPQDMAFVKKVVNPLDVVSYPATGSALRDAATAAADAQAALGDATILRRGLIGQQPPQDPETLESARLQSFSAALQSFMALDANAAFAALPLMPPALADPAVSGAIVIAASKPAEREELVFRVPPELANNFGAQLKQVIAGAAKVSSLVLPSAAAGALSKLVGVARFKPSGATLQPDSDDLAAGWASAGDGSAAQAIALLDPAGGDSPGDVDGRTDAIDAKVGLAPAKAVPTSLPAGAWDLNASMNPAFANARSALFLLVAPAFAKVTVYRADVAPGPTNAIESLKIGNLSAISQNPTLYQLLGTFDFNSSTGQIADPAALVKAWNANDQPPQLGRTFFQGGPNDAATVGSRAQAVMNALMLGGPVGQSKPPELDNSAPDVGPFKGAPMMMVIGRFLIL